MKFLIRRIKPEERAEDLRLLVPAYLEIWNHVENLPYLSFTGLPFEEAQVQDWCRAHVTAGVRYFGAIATDNELAGILLTRQNRIEGFELLSIGVMPIHKRLGIGRQLVRHGIDVAREKGYRAVDVQVYASNAPMLCLLLKEGFVPVRMEYQRGPRGEDLVHLKRYL